MNSKILSIKLWDYSIVCLFLSLVFVCGTFFPNPSIKEKIRNSTIEEMMIIDCVMATVKLVSENDIDELDINPLLVLKRGSGVIAVDTLIKLNLG